MTFRAGAEGSPARVTVNNLGLLGPEGPMPLHLTRWVLDRLSQRWFDGASARETQRHAPSSTSSTCSSTA